MVDADCSPPESLLKYEAPLYVGDSSSSSKPKPDSKGASSQIDEILNSVLPPREWQEESGGWMQYTSKNPATRLDVINLQEQMDTRLMDRQARETGICPVREDLYSQCFGRQPSSPFVNWSLLTSLPLRYVRR
jgi:dynein light intermediate chain